METESSVRKYHKSKRVAGRIKGRVYDKDKKTVRPKVLKAYVKKRQKSVGSLQAGWVKPARKLGVNKRFLSKYITNHNMPGGFKMKMGRNKFDVITSNHVKFVNDLDVTSRRMNYVLKAMTRSNERMMKDYTDKQAKKAGLGVS